MLKGAVDLRATIKGNGVTFTAFEFNPNEPCAEKVEIEASDGREIGVTVHFAAVASEAEAKDVVTKVTTAALNRIAFHHGLVIENARITGDSLSPTDSPPGTLTPKTGTLVAVGESSRIVMSISPATVKAQLEQAATPGERDYGLFRSARLATSPVEEFMVLYYILLLLHDDVQAKVDAFIVREDLTVPQTQDPRRQRSARKKSWWRGEKKCAKNPRKPDDGRRRTNEAPAWGVTGNLLAYSCRVVNSCRAVAGARRGVRLDSPAAVLHRGAHAGDRARGRSHCQSLHHAARCRGAEAREGGGWVTWRL